MTATDKKSILILGATGFVGRPLASILLSKRYSVTCLVRNLSKARKLLPAGAKLREGDVLNRDDVINASENIDIIYYLVHSIPSGEKRFERLDIEAAMNVVSAVKINKVNRIIYLGGLGRRDSETSAHLKSRHDVGKALRESGCPVTEFRAAMIAGKSGLSFEMIHHLVNRLPMMICPRWVYTKTQPIALVDVIRYLEECLDIPESGDKIIDIGGPDVLSYGDIMFMLSEAIGFKRHLIRVPVLTPRLSSYWVDLVTPIPASYARTLIEGLRYETICENNLADKLFNFKPMTLKDAVKKYPGSLNPRSGTAATLDSIDISHILTYHIEKNIKYPATDIFQILTKIGGHNGWFYANWLWKLRGAIDKLLGGIGYRKGRTHQTEIKIGDQIDFWRVEKYEYNKTIRLRAEMKIRGYAWLEFKTDILNKSCSKLRISAYHYPRGLLGHLYWYLTYPIHILIFKGMIRTIIRKTTYKKDKISRRAK